MSNKVTFDYSKAASFISGHEVEFMKKTGLGCEGSISFENRGGE